jgi:hypothetical protein
MPWPLTDKLLVHDHIRVGELFLAISKDRSLIKPPAERKQWLKDHGLELKYDDIVFVEDTATKIHFALREPAFIRAAEADVEHNVQKYPLDPEIYRVYNNLFGNSGPTLRDKAIKELLFKMRLCDYCVTLCA